MEKLPAGMDTLIAAQTEEELATSLHNRASRASRSRSATLPEEVGTCAQPVDVGEVGENLHLQNLINFIEKKNSKIYETTFQNESNGTKLVS